MLRKELDENGTTVKIPEKDYDEQGFSLIDDEDVEPEKDIGGLGKFWKCSWRMLPKVNPNHPTHKYIYKVQEKEVKRLYRNLPIYDF